MQVQFQRIGGAVGAALGQAVDGVAGLVLVAGVVQVKADGVAVVVEGKQLEVTGEQGAVLKHAAAHGGDKAEDVQAVAGALGQAVDPVAV